MRRFTMQPIFLRCLCWIQCTLMDFTSLSTNACFYHSTRQFMLYTFGFFPCPFSFLCTVCDLIKFKCWLRFQFQFIYFCALPVLDFLFINSAPILSPKFMRDETLKRTENFPILKTSIFSFFSIELFFLFTVFVSVRKRCLRWQFFFHCFDAFFSLILFGFWIEFASIHTIPNQK